MSTRHFSAFFILLIVALVNSLPALASPFDISAQLTPQADDTRIPVYYKASNPEAEDMFGSAVAISGDTLVIGAPGEDSGDGADPADNSAENAGAAYVFVRSNGRWVQQAYLKASNPDAGDRFGCSVGISGELIVVGADSEDGNRVDGQSDNTATDAGAAYVFTRSGASWSQVAYLKASNTDPGDSFGYSVAASGSTVVVGAYKEDGSATGVNWIKDNLAADAGAAYVFAPYESAWQQQAYLKASNTEADDWFGYQVAISGNLVVVGAPWEDGDGVGLDQSDNSAWDAGAAYSFYRSGTTWEPRVYLKASNAEAYDLFGSSVAVASYGTNRTIVVGASAEDSASSGVNGVQSDNSAVNAGAAYVFSYNDGTSYYPQEAYLKAANPDPDDRFGFSVALSPNLHIVVSAVNEDSAASGVNGDQSDDSAPNAGAAYTFYYQTGTGFLPGTYLKASNPEAGDLFGSQVAIEHENIIEDPPALVGARFESSSSAGVDGDSQDNSAFKAGAAYLPGPPQSEVFLPVVQSGSTP